MKYEFCKVIDGISKYLDSEIYSGMNEVQEFAARVFLGRFFSNHEALKQSLMNNEFLKLFNIIDEDGKVDVDTLATDIKREIARKDKITFSIPLFGKWMFKPSDVDVLVKTITGGDINENH